MKKRINPNDAAPDDNDPVLANLPFPDVSSPPFAMPDDPDLPKLPSPPTQPK